MIVERDFIEFVKRTFVFLETEFDYSISNEKIRENIFYEVEYKNAKRAISISYESTEGYLLILIMGLVNGELPDIEDSLNVKRVDKFISENIGGSTQQDFTNNNLFFKSINSMNGLEKKVLKFAKDLRLSLRNENLGK